MTGRLEPFLLQQLNAKYKQVPLEELKISVATMDVRLVEGADIDFRKLVELLPVLPKETYLANPGYRWPPGVITGLKHKDVVRGYVPRPGRGFKNSTTVWIWLESKDNDPVCAKISKDNIHIAGCKKFEHAAETAKLIRHHLIALQLQGYSTFRNYPFVVAFNVCMVNYNFNVQVAINLTEFDLFIDRECSLVYSPYDCNINNTNMPVKCHETATTFTVHANGQICMCVKGPDLEQAVEDISRSHAVFSTLLEHFHRSFDDKQ